MSIHHGDSQDTSPAECRSKIDFPTKGTVTPNEETKIKELPATAVASIKHGAPASRWRETCHTCVEWTGERLRLSWTQDLSIHQKLKVGGGETVICATIQGFIENK